MARFGMDQGTPLAEITTIRDIIELACEGFFHWYKYGDVYQVVHNHLTLLKYTGMAHDHGRWNFLERVSRGLIIDTQAGTVAARPFDKFFSWLEHGHRSNGHLVTITEKVDGSLGILYRNRGYHVATTGSFDSRQALWATKHLNDNYDISRVPDYLTLLFEIVYPDNRVVVNYGDKEELILLGARNRFTGDYLPMFPDLYDMAMDLGFELPTIFRFNNVGDIIQNCGELGTDFEGFVAEFSDGQRFKFKGDRYQEVQLLLQKLSFKNVVAAVRDGEFDALRSTIPIDFRGGIDVWAEEIRARVNEVEANARLAYLMAPNKTRETFVEWIKANHPKLLPYAYGLIDGVDILPMIYAREFRGA